MVLKCVATFLCLLMTCIATGQTIVEDVNFELGPPAIIFMDLPNPHGLATYFSLEHRGPHSSAFGIAPTLEMGFADLLFGGSDLGIGSDWFRAKFGQVFSDTSIANGDHEAWGSNSGASPLGSLHVRLNEDIWIAAKIINIDTEEDSYGWLQLVIGGDLHAKMLDNAMAYDADQIIVGRNVVPEPSSLTLLSIALIFLRRIS